MQPRRTSFALVLSVLATAALAVLPARAAPCAPPNAPDPMVEGTGHDHANPTQHNFACGLRQVAFDQLDGLVPEPQMFGEIDVAGNIAVMATAFPDAGFIVFDVSDPARPVALSRYFGPNCEAVAYDIDCGADLKLSRDGRTAFLAIQNTSRVPGVPRNPQSLASVPEPGIIAVDISDPTRPLFNSWMPVEPLGVHMFAYHEIGGQPYLFAINNGLGITVARVVRVAGVTTLQPLPGTDDLIGSAHDVFLYDDPVDRKTYLYVAADYSGMQVYDVTDPEELVPVSTWAPPAGASWYTHSVWAFRWGARRLAFVAPELFRGSGHNVPGPVWLVDTTDHGAPFLVATWTNPGNHKGRNLGFSPHNFWYSGDGMLWLAHYHGGVWLLDWKPVLNGVATRPDEAGYIVSSSANRPFVTTNARNRFITAFDLARERPSFWDVVSPDGRRVFASDVTGGFYVFERTS